MLPIPVLEATEKQVPGNWYEASGGVGEHVVAQNHEHTSTPASPECESPGIRHKRTMGKEHRARHPVPFVAKT